MLGGEGRDSARPHEICVSHKSAASSDQVGAIFMRKEGKEGIDQSRKRVLTSTEARSEVQALESWSRAGSRPLPHSPPPPEIKRQDWLPVGWRWSQSKHVSTSTQ